VVRGQPLHQARCAWGDFMCPPLRNFNRQPVDCRSQIDSQVLGSFPLEQLRELRMRESRCTVTAMSILSRASKLQTLDISGCSRQSCPSFLRAIPGEVALRAHQLPSTRVCVKRTNCLRTRISRVVLTLEFKRRK
jgi:hypothetical protein